MGRSQHLIGGDPRRAVLEFERQSVPRSRDVDQDGSYPESLRAISHLPTFGGKLLTFGYVDHPRPLSIADPTCRTSPRLFEIQHTAMNSIVYGLFATRGGRGRQ